MARGPTAALGVVLCGPWMWFINGFVFFLSEIFNDKKAIFLLLAMFI